MLKRMMSVAVALGLSAALIQPLLAQVGGGAEQSGAGGKFGDDAKTGDPRVKRALDEKEIKYEVDKDGDYKIIFKAGGDRTQLVFVNSHTEKLSGFEIREIWSLAYKTKDSLPADVANSLLKKNNSYKLGSWRIIEQKEFVYAVFAVQVSATVSADELADMIQFVVTATDVIELELTSKDEF